MKHHPTYLMLCGLSRLLAFLCLVFATATITVQLIEQARWSRTESNLFELVWYLITVEFVETFAPGCIFFAGSLIFWFFNKRIARLCTPRMSPNACHHCGYDLKDNPSENCPECGATKP